MRGSRRSGSGGGWMIFGAGDRYLACSSRPVRSFRVALPLQETAGFFTTRLECIAASCLFAVAPVEMTVPTPMRFMVSGPMRFIGQLLEYFSRRWIVG